MNVHNHKKTQHISLPMHRGSLHRIQAVQRGYTVICERGVLWLTQTGDPIDHFLISGQRYTLKKRGKVLIEALRDASMSILTPGEPPATHSHSLAQSRLA